MPVFIPFQIVSSLQSSVFILHPDGTHVASWATSLFPWRCCLEEEGEEGTEGREGERSERGGGHLEPPWARTCWLGSVPILFSVGREPTPLPGSLPAGTLRLPDQWSESTIQRLRPPSPSSRRANCQATVKLCPGESRSHASILLPCVKTGHFCVSTETRPGSPSPKSGWPSFFPSSEPQPLFTGWSPLQPTLLALNRKRTLLLEAP